MSRFIVPISDVRLVSMPSILEFAVEFIVSDRLVDSCFMMLTKIRTVVSASRCGFSRK